MAHCGSCGEENPARARFCVACGAALGGASGEETRRSVTVLFADMVASTERVGSLDPEAWRSVQRRYFDGLRRAVERHGGTVEKYIGDAVMAVFGWPALHEDDALRAVRAAVELGPAIADLDAELRGRGATPIELRVGIATGEVLATGDDAGGDALVTGDAVTRAARLQQAAGPREVLVDAATLRLVRDAVEAEALGHVDAKGVADGIPAHRLLRMTGEDAHRRRFETPLVGRAAELSALADGLDRAIRAREVELVTVMAPAGVGKSRLVREFLEHAATGATILRGRCLSYGDGITYWALAEVVREAAGIEEADDARTAQAKVAGLVAADGHADRVATILESVLGLTRSSASGDEIGWAIRKLLGLLGAARPVVILLEDLHWAAPDLLDLVESVVDWGVGEPVLLVGTARPDLLEARPGFGAGRPNATTLSLDPLGPVDADALVALLPGGPDLPPPLRARIGAAAEGNPLFVEEMLGMLVDLGHLLEADGRWTMRPDVGDVAVPSSIRALLAARIDALERGERSVAERAAVVGRSFERSAVAELTALEERGRLASRLLSLTRKQLIRRDEPGLGGDDAFRFRHVLIRDAAYEALPKATRADLHERFATWLDRVAGDRRLEYVEILAHHLATAVEYRAELGTLGDRPDLPNAAVAGLLTAAERAESIHAYPEAARLLRRTVALIDALPIASRPTDPGDLLEQAAEAARNGGDVEGAVELGDAALARASASDPVRLARLHANAAAYARDAGANVEEARHVAEARRLLADGGDSRERAIVLARLARMLMLARQDPASEALSREVLASGVDDPETLASAAITLGTALFNQGRRDEARIRFGEGRDRAEMARSGHQLARWYVNYSIFVGSERGSDDAAELLRKGLTAMADHGMAGTPEAIAMALNLGVHDLDNGRAGAVETAMRELLESGISGTDAVFAAVQLFVACTQLGRLEEAQEAVGAARRLARRWGLADNVSDLAYREAELCLWTDRPERAMELATESRSLATPGDRRAVVRADVIELRALADIAGTARDAGDGVTAGAAAARAEVLHEAICEAYGADSSPWPEEREGMVLRVQADAERARAHGETGTAAWAEVADRLRVAGWLVDVLYARWRYAEALEAAGADPMAIRTAIQAGLAEPVAHEPARRELLAMAERLGIDVPAGTQTSPPRR